MPRSFLGQVVLSLAGLIQELTSGIITWKSLASHSAACREYVQFYLSVQHLKLFPDWVLSSFRVLVMKSCYIPLHFKKMKIPFFPQPSLKQV